MKTSKDSPLSPEEALAELQKLMHLFDLLFHTEREMILSLNELEKIPSASESSHSLLGAFSSVFYKIIRLSFDHLNLLNAYFENRKGVETCKS